MKKMRQNQNNYLLKFKKLSGILALIIGASTFSVNYYIALQSYPEAMPLWATRLLYQGCFVSQSLLFLALTIGAKKKVKQLIYYAGSNFWMFLTIAYLLNQFFDILIKQNKIVFTLILTCFSCIVYYLLSHRLQ
jgi:hypothetical protein